MTLVPPTHSSSGIRVLIALAVLATAAGCPSCQVTDVHVCDPECPRDQTCNLKTIKCEPILCSRAQDCGDQYYFRCAAPDAGLPKQCDFVGCTTDEDCSDGQWCNGDEKCNKSDPAADVNGCVAPTAPRCAAPLVCRESLQDCRPVCIDEDEDGECSDTDCDDHDPSRFHGHFETCDGVDNDCDPTTLGDTDNDNDGHISSMCCNPQPDGGTLCGDDCNDNDPFVSPSAPEVCNGIDDNCNGQVDEGVQVAAYPDNDHDTYGAADAGPTMRCPNTLGSDWSLYNNDCDDQNPSIHPGSLICDPANGVANVLICGSDGVFNSSKCFNQGLCVTQPDTLGVCE